MDIRSIPGDGSHTRVDDLFHVRHKSHRPHQGETTNIQGNRTFQNHSRGGKQCGALGNDIVHQEYFSFKEPGYPMESKRSDVHLWPGPFPRGGVSGFWNRMLPYQTLINDPCQACILQLLANPQRRPMIPFLIGAQPGTGTRIASRKKSKRPSFSASLLSFKAIAAFLTIPGWSHLTARTKRLDFFDVGETPRGE